MDSLFGRTWTKRQIQRQNLMGAAAAAALAQTGQAPSMGKLIGLLSHSDPCVREGAVKNIAKIRGPDGILAIGRSLADRDPRVRVAACRALGMLRAHQTKSKLYDAVVDKDAEVRCAAAEALGRMGDKYGLPYVAKLVCLRGDHQYAALRALNVLTGNDFRCNDHGLGKAIAWVRREKDRLGH
ncbi:MAG: HEAT repeat domain-containing protein [Sedimentisphaerales bacterium]|nr:HEAT repeat domain-containing protein [Sedimentisphaerales bacterium]